MGRAEMIELFTEFAREGRHVIALLLRGPGVRPGRPDALVSGLDVLPTLLAFAGVEPEEAACALEAAKAGKPPLLIGSYVSVAIEDNTVTAFIGPSGCGKSTFLKTLDRMNDLISYVRIEGNVYYDGIDIYREFDVTDLRKKIGMVFQKPNPFQMSVYDNIASPMKLLGHDASQIDREVREAALDALVDCEVEKGPFSRAVAVALRSPGAEVRAGLVRGLREHHAVAPVLPSVAALLADALDVRPQVAPAGRVQSDRWFIQKDNSWLMNKSTSQG